MTFELSQKQSKSLLEEHAKFSFNFSFWIRNEWIFAVVFLFIGLAFLIFENSIRSTGYLSVFIGILELIKFSRRSNKWVSRKMKESNFDKEITFKIDDKGLNVIIDKVEKKHPFDNMRACNISETGILFKISYTEYYYISFRTIEKEYLAEDVVGFLKRHFDSDKLKLKH
jgi:hypothetical protein